MCFEHQIIKFQNSDICLQSRLRGLTSPYGQPDSEQTIFFKNLPSTIQTWNIEPTILHHHLSYWWEKREIINLLCLKWSSTNCSVPILTTGDQSLRQSFDKQGRFFLCTFLMILEDLSSLFQIFADHYISIYQ